MIQMKTRLDVADNTGARMVGCIKVLGHGNKKYAEIGDIIVGSAKKVLPGSTIKQGEVVKAVVIRTKDCIGRRDGSYVRFDSNAIVLIDNEGNPRGTRVFGAVPRELRKSFMKIVSLAAEVV